MAKAQKEGKPKRNRRNLNKRLSIIKPHSFDDLLIELIKTNYNTKPLT